jgi:hypothetical protein
VSRLPWPSWRGRERRPARSCGRTPSKPCPPGVQPAGAAIAVSTSRQGASNRHGPLRGRSSRAGSRPGAGRSASSLPAGSPRAGRSKPAPQPGSPRPPACAEERGVQRVGSPARAVDLPDHVLEPAALARVRAAGDDRPVQPPRSLDLGDVADRRGPRRSGRELVDCLQRVRRLGDEGLNLLVERARGPSPAATCRPRRARAHVPPARGARGS